MNPDTLHLILAIAVPLAAGGAAYGGVRAGMRALSDRVTRAEGEIDRAHERIDRLQERVHAH